MGNVLSKELSLFYFLRTRLMIKVFNLMPNHDFFNSIRILLLLLSGFNVKRSAKIFSPIAISPKTFTSNITIESNAFVNSNARFSAPGNSKICIGKNCLIGPNVVFETVNHNNKYVAERNRGAIVGDIILNEGVWVGCNTILLQNVEIGLGAVVAAGSVVTKSVGENLIVGGVPARIIRSID